MILAAVGLSTIAATSEVNATQIDYDGSNYIMNMSDYSLVNLNMGLVGNNQYGTISNPFATNTVPGYSVGVSEFQGYLPANYTISFSYSFTGLTNQVVPFMPFQASVAQTFVGVGGNYNLFNVNGPMGYGHYSGYIDSETPTTYSGGLPRNTSLGFFNGNPAPALISATTSININASGVSTAVGMYTNTSPFAMYFGSDFEGVFLKSSSGSVSYAVTPNYVPTSLLPVPASLPMFTAIIAGMFGLSRRQAFTGCNYKFTT